MFGLRVVAVVGLLAACSSSGEETQPGPLTVRVSTHFGVQPMEPDPFSTVTVSLANLVYRPLRDQYTAIELKDGLVRLTPRDGHPSIDAIKHPFLASKRIEGDEVVLALSDPQRARQLDLDSPVLDIGPYRQDSFAGEVLRLRRRSGDGPEIIEIVNVPTEEEEWRRFLAREVDILPYASPRHLEHLRDVPSVRVLPNRQPSAAALIFRVPNLPDLEVRRALALALRRASIAYVVTGDRSDAVKAPEDLQAAQRVLDHPTRLRLVVLDVASDYQRAALVIEQQLALANVDVDIEVLSMEEMGRRLKAGDWDAWVFFGGYQPRYFYLFLTADAAGGGGYSNPDFDAAARAGDAKTATAILEHDVPATPLYRVGDGVAFDRSLCSDLPEVVTDFSWLASVHRCAPGEGE